MYSVHLYTHTYIYICIEDKKPQCDGDILGIIGVDRIIGFRVQDLG